MRRGSRRRRRRCGRSASWWWRRPIASGAPPRTRSAWTARCAPTRCGPGVFSIDGTPVDCVYLALLHLVPRKPDLVVSGINHGYNLGSDVFYSGTVAAAVEGALRGVPGIAFSLERRRQPDFAPVAGFVRAFVGQVLERGAGAIPQGALLNVNAPSGAAGRLRDYFPRPARLPGSGGRETGSARPVLLLDRRARGRRGGCARLGHQRGARRPGVGDAAGTGPDQPAAHRGADPLAGARLVAARGRGAPGGGGRRRARRRRTEQASDGTRAPAWARMGLLLSHPRDAGACAHAPPPMHPPGPEGSFYVVRAGDTLASLARERRVPLEDLAEINGLPEDAPLTAGQVIFVLTPDPLAPRAGGGAAGGGGGSQPREAPVRARPTPASEPPAHGTKRHRQGGACAGRCRRGGSPPPSASAGGASTRGSIWRRRSARRCWRPRRDGCSTRATRCRDTATWWSSSTPTIC